VIIKINKERKKKKKITQPFNTVSINNKSQYLPETGDACSR
jgi:hypothetical protein